MTVGLLNCLSPFLLAYSSHRAGRLVVARVRIVECKPYVVRRQYLKEGIPPLDVVVRHAAGWQKLCFQTLPQSIGPSRQRTRAQDRSGSTPLRGFRNHPTRGLAGRSNDLHVYRGIRLRALGPKSLVDDEPASELFQCSRIGSATEPQDL